MFKTLMLNLQLFAEGSAPASGGQATGETTGNAQATAENVPGLPSSARRKTKENPLANVKYGKQDTEDTASAQAEQSETPAGAAAENDMTFDELVKSDKYKADFTKAIENIVSQRMKKYKGMEAQIEKLQPILQLAGNQYGIDPSDADFVTKLSAAMNSDDHFYEKYAVDHGCSVDEAKRIVTLKQEIADLDRKKQEREKQEAFERDWGRILTQADTTKQQFPQFDLDKEMQNERFARLVANGVDTTAAFIATNHKNIIPATVQLATEKAVQQTVNAVKANKARPIENGLSSSATAIVKDDPSKLTLEDFKRIRDNFRKTGERPKF